MNTFLLQIPVTSYASHFGHNYTAETAPSSTLAWHTPTPYPFPYNPAAYSVVGPSSSSSLSSRSSSPASASSSSPGLQQKVNDYSSNNWQTVNQGQSSSTVTAGYISTIPSQVGNLILPRPVVRVSLY